MLGFRLEGVVVPVAEVVVRVGPTAEEWVKEDKTGSGYSLSSKFVVSTFEVRKGSRSE